MGTSYLRTLNATSLRKLVGAVVVQDNDVPLVVIIPYKAYLDWQDDAVGDTIETCIEEDDFTGKSAVVHRRVPAKPRKQSRKAAAIEALKASDPMANQRPEIEYGSDELPSGGSIVAAKIRSDIEVFKQDLNRPPEVAIADWRAERKPLLKPGGKK